MKPTKAPRSPGNPLQVRVLVAFLGLAPAGCSLLVQFDPDGQPCDQRAASDSQCLPGSRCTEGVCVRFDGGLFDGGPQDGGFKDAGASDGGHDGGSEPDGGLLDGGLPDAGLDAGLDGGP